MEHHYSWLKGIMLTLAITLMISPLLTSSAPQQFYPNGRYGRRSSMPMHHDGVAGREMTVAFFGDGSVSCAYTGHRDFYRCSRKSLNFRSTWND